MHSHPAAETLLVAAAVLVPVTGGLRNRDGGRVHSGGRSQRLARPPAVAARTVPSVLRATVEL
ncbi:hypothetical protein GCM10009828_017640 [Actinoplanes couchii]|uniref:Secreted protein n=1 Tax=Actinoplanes couchii TaxID=403638 RepID=A0ABQ3XTB6_9ACTN|nr:hypothetical protein Aco03nite_101540 [Actinoplanes couchii]